jgi:ribosomal protein S18 acetylase RimI-like enzyme
MSEPEFHIRRCRRTDFTAVMQLLTASGAPAPLPDRRTLRRFRAIVNDLGGDLYVGTLEGVPAAIVHVTYVRQLTLAPRASIERLVVDERFRGRGFGSALFRFARERAIRRGCGTLDCLVPAGNAQAEAFFEKVGLRPDGSRFVDVLGCDIAVEGGARESGDGS